MKKAFFCIFLTIFTAFFGCKDDKSTDFVVESSDSIDLAAPIDTMGEIVMRIQQQSKLYTTECHVRKVVLFSDDAVIGGRLLDISVPGHRKTAVPIDVTLKAYVDFSTFSAENVMMRDSLCVVTLPDPKVVITSSRIDHEGTRQYISTMRSRFSDAELTALAAQGQDTIASHIAQYGLEEHARTSCARMLVPMLKRMGYDEGNVVIRFRKKFNDAELRPITSTQK